jgi:osmoprotectant transport system permease protein
MGMTDRQILWKVELPMSVPEIIAGVRIATVSTVAIATLAVFAGAGGLGEVIYSEGVQNDLFKTNILVASGLVIVMAIVIDAILLVCQRVLSPWRKVRTV